MSPNRPRLAKIARILAACGLAVALLTPRAHALENNGFTTKILGYHVSWRGWTDGPDKIPWDHFTHLSYFALAAQPNGSLGCNDACPGPTPCWTDAMFQSLAVNGHAHDVKIGVTLVAANYPDWSTYQDSIHAFLGPAVRPVLIGNIVSKLTAAGGDGVDVDIEWPRPADSTAYASFVGELATAVHTAVPGSYIYVAVPAWDYPGLNNYPTLAASCDGLAIMGYGYHGDFGGSEPGPVAPIDNGATWFNPPFDLIGTVDWYEARGIAPSKLLLGFPVYATEFPTTSDSVPGHRATGTVTYPLVKDDYPYLSTPIDDCERLFSVSKKWDADSQTPYSVRYVNGQWRQLFGEDLASMAAKFQLIKDRGLAGTFFWAENYLPHTYPFWRMVDQNFKQTPPVNQAPVVAIIPHAPVDPGDSVTLDAGTPSDPDGDGLILQWALQSGPPGPALVYAAANEKKLTTIVSTPGNYTFTLTATDGIATSTARTVLIVRDPASVNEAPPQSFALSAPRPSPSAGAVALEFSLPRAADVRLSIVDVQGREVQTLASGFQSIGRHTVIWNGRYGAGRAPAGIYFARLMTPERSFVRRLVILP